ncbi:MAG TPA: lactate utilization protein [Pyrinomonadaceae bacterium]|nr:lactate utilization protein [Pyrinomonadaceae bacterium]
MTDRQVAHLQTDARAEILQSIRSCLAESASLNPHESPASSFDVATAPFISDERSLVEVFKQQLESVGGHCAVVGGETELRSALQEILVEIESKGLLIRSLALSDSPLLGAIARELQADGHEVAVTPATSDLFQFNVGITTAQAAIAETGTLVLEQASERNRLISLLPPVHIAIVNAVDVCATLREAISRVRATCETSPAITFITGPSRTADIELTLTIGVHGPKELYVIVHL